MNLVKTGRWIYVDITLLYVPPVYYVYHGWTIMLNENILIWIWPLCVFLELARWPLNKDLATLDLTIVTS